jgi:phosphonoacetaldehyde hydrolase
MKNIKKIQAVVFDWSGTTVDFGCRAPLAVIMEIFKNKGLPITVEEASKPMGMLKIDHFRELFKMERIKGEYLKKYNKLPDESSLKEFYTEFEPMLFKILPEYSDPIPGVVEVVEKLRMKYQLKIGSTTGFTREMLNYVSPVAQKMGYQPDYSITSSEVKSGRPQPWMMYQNAYNLGISQMSQIVKIGDTVADIGEGRNAGSWSIGILEGSNLLGYTLEEFKKADKKEILKKKEEVKKVYQENKADFIINKMRDLPDVIEQINEKLNHEEYPGSKFHLPPQPYLLFTPGPITTSHRVKAPMMTDWGSRETDYLELVQNVRKELVNLALLDSPNKTGDYTTTIIQGSGTFGVEACIASSIPANGKLLVIINGQYGLRISKIAHIYNIPKIDLEFNEDEIPSFESIDQVLTKNKDITHVAVIHSETTTGILNPIQKIGEIVKRHQKVFIVDAMSSMGAVPIDMNSFGIDFLISSSNKNIQGVPGFSFVVAKKDMMQNMKSNPPRSLSLDLYDQWNYLEKTHGGFRFTSPVHVIRSFYEAIQELKEEGGVQARFKRYTLMQKTLSNGMRKLNFVPLDLKGNQGPIITTFHNPKSKDYDFEKFYNLLKDKQCVIYPGKLTKVDSFRIGTIGHLNVKDVENLIEKVKDSIFWDNSLL